MFADPFILVLVRVTDTLPPDGAVTLSVPPLLTVDTPGDDIVNCAVGPVCVPPELEVTVSKTYALWPLGIYSVIEYVPVGVLVLV
jgi:hypothetical protein